MFNPELLSLLNRKYSRNEQRIILRAILQNPIIENHLNQEEFQKYFLTNQANSITFFKPASIALNLLGLDISLANRLISEPLQPVESDLLKQATDVYQRVLLQKGFQAELDDAFLVSLFLRENFIQTKTWHGVSEKAMIGEDGESEERKQFWGLVLACLNNIIPDSWKFYGQLLIEKSTQEAIVSVIQSLLMIPLSDDELQDEISKILVQQRLAVNIRFLDFLNQFGFPDVVKAVARSLISSSPHLCIGIEEIDKSLQNFNWINADDLAQKIQHIAVLNAFAGNQEKANALIERVKAILVKQSDALGKIQKELVENIESPYHNDGNLFSILPETNIKNEKINIADCPESLTEEENYLLHISPYKKVEELISVSNFIEANKQLERIRQYRKSDPTFFRLSAEINLQLGGFQEALNDLLIAQSLNQSDRSIQRLLARSYFYIGEFSKAFDIANSLYESQKVFSNEEVYELCEYALKNNKPEFALNIYEEKFSEGNTSAGIILQAAESNYQMNRISAALDYLKKAIELGKNNPQIWLLLAKIENANGDGEKALEALITAKRYATNSQEICFELSKRYFECGNKTAYEEMIGEMVNVPLVSVSLTNAIVQFLRKNQNTQCALGLLNSAMKKWPKNVELAVLLVEFLIEKKSYIQASSMLETFYKNNQLDAQGLRVYLFSILRCNSLIFPINTELSENNLQKVSELISQLSKIAPDDFWTKLIQAEFLHLQKKNSEAFDAYRNLLLDLPKTQTDLLWRIQVGMGRILIEIEQTDTAIVLLSEALDQSPSIFEIHQFIADTYRLNGLEEKALQIANHAIEIFLDNSLFYQWYAKLIANLNKRETAIQWLKDKVNTQQGANDIILLMASVELELGNKDNVEKILDEVVKQTHLIPAHMQIIANMYARISNFPPAIGILTRSLLAPVNDRKKIKFELAGLHRQQNNFQETEKALREDFDNIDEIYLQKLFLAEIYFNSNNLEQLKPLLIFLVKDFENIQLLSEFSDHLIASDDYFFPDVWKWFFQAKENLGIFLAKCLFSIGELDRSLEIAEKALNLNPMNLALREFSAELAYSLLLDSKADQLANVEFNHTEGKQEDFNYYLGLICLRAELALNRGEDIHAASLITNSLQGNEDNPRLQCLQARLLNRQGDLENAAKFYEKAKEQIRQLKIKNTSEPMPKSPAIWVLEPAKEMGDFEEVFSLLHELVESNKIMPRIILAYLKMRIELEVLESQANELMVKNNHLSKPQNLKDFDPIIEKAMANSKNNNPELIRWHSLYKLIMGFESDKIIVQEKTDTIPFLAYWYRKSNNIEGLNYLNQKYSDNPDVHFQISQALMSTNPAESKKQLSEAIALNSHNPYFYAALAILENGISDPQKALAAIEQGLILWQNEPNWHIFAADMAEKSGDWNKKLSHLEKANEIDPQNLKTRKKLVSVYYQNNRVADAARLIKENNNKGVESFEELVILARAALADNNYKESYDYASRAKLLNDISPIPYLVLSELALKLNKLDKAMEYSQRAIKCDPENVEAHIVMAKIIGIQKDKYSALNYLELILKKGIKTTSFLCEISSLKKELFGTKPAFEFLLDYQNENDEMILCQLALFEMELNNIKDAENFALASLLLNPHQADLKKILGQIAQQNGNLDQAVKYFTEAIQCDPENSERYLDACNIYIYRREVVKALDVLEQGIKTISNDWRLFQKAGKIYWEMKDYIKAELLIRQASELNLNDQQLKRQLSALSAMNIIHQKQEALS